METVITMKGLRKVFGTFEAVKGLDLSVFGGEVLGFLGPNGAGKTTTLSMLSLLMKPTAGELEMFGEPAGTQHKPKIGLVPQDLALYEELNAWEHLEFFAGLYGITGKDWRPAAEEALSFVGLLDRANDRAGAYSGGMKRRLNLACGIVHRPELIFLDEPTVGVDPQSRNHIFERVLELRDQGATVIYTTHYMEEVERLCDRIAILDQGRLLAVGAMNELLEQLGAVRRIEATPGSGAGLPESLRAAGFTEIRVDKGRPSWNLRARDLPAIEMGLALLRESGVALARIQVREASLEEVFLELTGARLRD